MVSFGELRSVNVSRKIKWHGDTDGWIGSDWATAMGGECGEALNVVKKLRRAEMGIANRGDPDPNELKVMLGFEIADTVIYGDLLAAYYGIDLNGCVVTKFNAVSVKFGFPERL